jgi:DNA (cytosine-5)-methyltransferase 1
MDHREKLLFVYMNSFNISDIDNISGETMGFMKNIIGNIDRNKGVYTVLVTLMVHKLLKPEQDIRYFQSKMKNGFSARTIDTQYITPALKELELPSMAESGWLTRSLEQPYPYTMDYKGEISGKGMKEAFLGVVDAFQKDQSITENLLRLMLNGAVLFARNNRMEIRKISGSDRVSISTIVYKNIT